MSSKWNFWSVFRLRNLFGVSGGFPLCALLDESEPSITIEKQVGSGSLCFRAQGLSRSILQDLSGITPTDPEFVRRFPITEIGDNDRSHLVVGTYFVEGGSLIFIPDQALHSGHRYLASLALPDPVSDCDVGSLFMLQSEFALRTTETLAA